MGVVYVGGSFDIINAGHCKMFQLAKEQGNRLVVGLNSDDIIRADKGREPIIPWTQRKIILESIKYIDEVIKVEDIYALPYLKELNADVYVTIEDWKDRQKEAIDWIINKGGRIFTPPYFPEDGVILSSSMIRQRVIEGAK